MLYWLTADREEGKAEEEEDGGQDDMLEDATTPLLQGMAGA